MDTNDSIRVGANYMLTLRQKSLIEKIAQQRSTPEHRVSASDVAREVIELGLAQLPETQPAPAGAGEVEE